MINAQGCRKNAAALIDFIMKKYNLKVGDKIMQIDGVNVKNALHVDEIMKTKNAQTYYLISRDDFQFFVRVNR